MSNPILEISNGTISVNLIEGRGGFGVIDWRPAIAPSKGGGIWQNSPMADGRRLVIHHFDNTVETFNLTLNSGSMDSVIEKGQKLRRLLQDARDYWVSNRNDAPPVYIKARAPNETNTRYALIYDWQTPNDANPFTTPFFGCGDSAMPDLLLVVERGHWQADAPLSSTCVMVNSIQDYEESGAQTGALITVDEVTTVIRDGDSETAGPNTDPFDYSAQNYSPAGLYFGASGVGGNNWDYEFALRFRAVDLPPHALIDTAYVTLKASANSTAGVQHARIYVENRLNPPQFEHYVGYWAGTPFHDRFYGTAYQAPLLSPTYVAWDIPQVVDGNSYNSDSITTLVQYIVDTPWWVQGTDIVVYFRSVGNAITGGVEDYRKFRSPFSPWVEADGPILHVEYHIASDATYGQEDTCSAGTVFVANKHNRANISHIFRYDDSIATYSSNLITAAGLPYDLLPATPAADDIVYFGIDITLQNSGPFGSLVFDISEVSNHVYGKWQYYNGTTVSWEDLDVTDNTIDAVLEASFTVLGVNSVHWIQNYQWEAVAINGVTAYWVRFIVTSVGAAPDSPIQQNRLPYTIVTPFVDIDAAQVGGDIAALSAIYIQNMSDDSFYDVKLQAKRVITGLRTLDRGAKFTPYLNIGGSQNLISAAFNPLVDEFVWASTGSSPTGTIGHFVTATTFSMAAVAEIIFQGEELSNYIGTFRAFLRTLLITGTITDISAKISMTFGEEDPNFYTEEVVVESAEAYYPSLTDLGLFTVLPGTLNPNESYQSGKIQLLLANNGVDPIDLHVLDLILMPADEWFCDTYSQTNECLRKGNGNQRELRIDAIGNPRLQLRSLLCSDENGVALDTWQIISSSPPILQANKDQRLWFLVDDTDRDVPNKCSFEAVHAVRVFKSQRYFSMRGSR